MTMTPEKQDELRQRIRELRGAIPGCQQEVEDAWVNLRAKERQLRGVKDELMHQQHRLSSELTGPQRETDPDLSWR